MAGAPQTASASMARYVAVNGAAGELCQIQVEEGWTTWNLKEAISQVPPSERRKILFVGSSLVRVVLLKVVKDSATVRRKEPQKTHAVTQTEHQSPSPKEHTHRTPVPKNAPKQQPTHPPVAGPIRGPWLGAVGAAPHLRPARAQGHRSTGTPRERTSRGGGNRGKGRESCWEV